MTPMDGVQLEGNGQQNDGPPPRLMITKMVLENFKSYAGVKEIGPFHKCFSSVVGPNGSGKSNVIDAMLFVFGKRAKKLRLNKVSELIHKSDAVDKNNPPQYARVSVYFQEIIDTGDGDDDYDIVPNSETVVSRTAKKDNSSQYQLDGKNCKFKEIAQLLHSKGIDLDNNRFLILQGEVEMISMMPPKGKTESDEGLLEYLEDIIGSSKFVQQTNEAAEKVESLSEQRQEKLNRVKAVEKEKDCLEAAKLEAEALLTKERDIRRQKNILYQIHQNKAQSDITRIQSEKDNIQKDLDVVKEKQQQTKDRISSINKELAGQRKEYDDVFAELQKTKEEFTAYERKDIQLREELKHAKEQMKTLEKKVKQETKKHENAIAKANRATESIPKLQEDIQELSDLKEKEDLALEAIYDDVKSITQTLRMQLESKTQELAPVKQERAVFQASLETAQTELQLLNDSRERAMQKLTAAEKELSELDQKQSSKRDQLKQLQEELVSTKSRIEASEAEERDLAQQESNLAQQHKELVAKVEATRSAMQESNNGQRSKAVQGILRAAQKGGELASAGILGRLGDLAAINEQYDVAISTACGMLDHLVVHTTAGAQRCLDFLRRHNLGRANFIPLDKMKKGAHDRAVETPENAPRLFNLITPKHHNLLPALFLAVGNTLVAPDLETATRWAYDFSRRWRVVTLDGKLIETTGTMAGGGKSVRRGGMRLTNARMNAMTVSAHADEEEFSRLETELEQIQSKLQGCKQKRRHLFEEIKSLKKSQKSLEVKLPRLTLEISGCDTTREELTKLIPGLRAQCEKTDEDETKRRELEQNVENCRVEMSACSTNAEKLESEVAAIQKSIMEAGGSKLKKQKAACAKVLNDLNDAEKALNAAKVEASTAEKAAKKANTAKEKFTTESEKSAQVLEAKRAELKELEDGALAVMEAFETVKQQEDAKRKELEGASKEVDELKKSQSDMKCTEIGLLGQVEALDKNISELNKKKQHWQNEIRKLQKAEADAEYDGEDDLDHEDSNETSEKDAAKDDPMDDEEEEDEDGDEKGSMDSTKNLSSDKASKSEDDSGRTCLPVLSSAALEKYSVEEIKNVIAVLETERNSLAKNANMGAISEYKKKEADYLSRVSELDEVTEERNAARKTHEELRRQRLEMFMDGFGRITLKLKEMYQMITLGGDAELELVDSLDPFSEGIVFSVRPPKKSWKNISNLSGGEKTLSSLALVFALHHYKPTPLYVMDEIDAALDFKNVSIVANYIKERTKNAQFIIISLRNNMFELADRLVGIYKTNNCTKSVTINPRAFLTTEEDAEKTQSMVLPLQDRSNVDLSAVDDTQKSRDSSMGGVVMSPMVS